MPMEITYGPTIYPEVITIAIFAFFSNYPFEEAYGTAALDWISIQPQSEA
jgi:hypothetical protein